MATWYNLTFNYKDVLTALNMTRLDGNLDALAEGASGAPSILTAAIGDDQITVGKLAHNIDATGIGFDAAKLDGYDAGNASGQIPISNGTLCTNLNANKLEGYAASAFAVLGYSGAKVYDAAAPAAFTDLDLSGTVGANRAMIYLKVKLDDVAGSDTYYFRENGETDTIGTGSPLVIATIANNQEFVYLWIFTDASGIVEWYSVNQRNTELYVLTYIKTG